MGERTGIEWTNHTWNPWRGCIKVSAGCKNCYMYRDQARYGRDPRTVMRAAPATFNAPLKWVDPAFVFTCSWSDWFIEEADEWRADAWDIIRRTPHLTYQILTKRPENMATRLPEDWGDGWPNVWLGVSAEDQATADLRIPQLLTMPAAVRFLSAEPLLGSLRLDRYIDRCPRSEHVNGWQHGWRFDGDDPYVVCAWCGERRGNLTGRVVGMRWTEPGLDWVITGGESGPGCRPADFAWFRSIRDQCQAAGVALFHKQHGGTARVGGHWGGRELDGRTWDEIPAMAVTHA